MAEAGRLEYIVTVDSSGVNSGLSKAESKVKGSGNKMSAWTVAKGQMIGRMIERAGAATVRATTTFVKSSISEGMNFDKSMSQVAATLGKSVDEVQDLSKFARQMGATTAFTAQEAAEGLNYMALAGYDAEKSMKMLPQVLNLAAAGNFDLARASDMVTDAQSALGLSIEETETLIDQMAKASSKTNTSVEQLGDAILTIGGTARNIKGGTKELTMLLGVLADNGIKGSEGGTALRNVLLRLSAPTDKAAKELKGLGVNAFDAQGNLRALPDIFSDFNEALGDKTMQERMAIFSEIFNVRDLKAIEALLGTSKKRWSELSDEIGNADGAAKEMAETQLDNLAGDVTKFKSALGEAKLTISDKLTPSLRNFVKAGIAGIERVTNAFKRGGLTAAMKESWSILKDLSKVTAKHAKINLAKWLDVGDDASWAEIARKAVTKIGEGFRKKLGKGGNFLLQMILGEDYKAGESTWKDAGTKISGWMTDAFSEGGILEQLLIGGSEKLATIIKLAGEFITGVATWISENPGTISDIITSISTALTTAVPSIVNALVEVLNNQDFQAAIMGLFGTFAEMLGTVMTEGPDALKALLIGYGTKKGFDLFKWVKGLGLSSGVETAATGGGGFLQTILSSGAAKALGGAAAFFTTLFDTSNHGSNDIWDKNTGKLTEQGREAGFTEEDAAELKESEARIRDRQARIRERTKLSKKQENALEAYAIAYGNVVDENGRARTDHPGYQRFAEAAKKLRGMLDNGEFRGREKQYQAYIDKIHSSGKNAHKNFEDFFNIDDQGIVFNIDDDEALAGMDELKGKAEDVAGEYKMTFDIETNGEVPSAPTPKKRPPQLPHRDSNAKGNWYVPYDNYPALLHRGELVMNKSQARQYRDGEGGFDMGGMISNAVSAAMSKVYVMLNGDKVGDLTSKRINKNINATSYNKLRAMGGY